MAYKPPIQIKVEKKQKVHLVKFTFQTEFEFNSFCAEIHRISAQNPTNAYLTHLSDLLDKADRETD